MCIVIIHVRTSNLLFSQLVSLRMHTRTPTSILLHYKNRRITKYTTCFTKKLDPFSFCCNFGKYCIGRLSSKFVVNFPLKIPPYLKYLTTGSNCSNINTLQ